MNWRRGLFRLWIVGAALFVIAVGFISYGDIKEQFDRAAQLFVPVPCGKARGAAGVDYSTGRGPPNYFDKFDKPNSFDTCWYAVSKFRMFYPEHNGLQDKELVPKLYSAFNTPPFEDQISVRPWFVLGIWASIAVGIPLVVL